MRVPQLWLIATVLLFGSSALAQQITLTVPGSNCRVYGPQSGDTVLSPSGGNATGIKNTGTTSRNIVCPVWRRMEAESIVVADMEVSGSPSDWSSSGCSLRATSANGQTEIVAPSPTISAHGSGSTILWNQPWSLGADNTVAFYCSAVPAGRWIFKAEIVEEWFDSPPSVGGRGPGSLCKLSAVQSSDDVLAYSGGNATGIRNTGGSSVTAICPVPRTFGASGNEWVPIDEARVYVSTAAAAQATDCSFRVTSYNGQEQWVSGTATLTNSGSYSRFRWTGLAVPNVEPFATVAFQCLARSGQWIHGSHVFVRTF